MYYSRGANKISTRQIGKIGFAAMLSLNLAGIVGQAFAQNSNTPISIANYCYDHTKNMAQAEQCIAKKCHSQRTGQQALACKRIAMAHAKAIDVMTGP